MVLIKASRAIAAQRRKHLRAKEPVPTAIPLHCPKCQALFEEAMCQNLDSVGPNAGAMGLCRACGEVLVFESSTVIRSAGPLDMVRAPRELAEWSADIKAMRKQN